MFARSRVMLASVLLLSAFGGLSFTGVADAAPAATAVVRSAHFSPETPGVDIYLTAAGGKAALWVRDETYGGVSAYRSVAPGKYLVAMRQHGAPSDAAPLLSWQVTAEAGRAYTAAALGTGSKRTGTVLDDNLTAPALGKARVRLIQAASVAPKATVVALDGPILARNAAYATATGYAQIAAGTWPLKAQSSSMPALTAVGSVSVPAGSVTSILLLDKKGGGLELKSVLDAAGVGKVPAGAVPAGGGGTARSFTTPGDSTFGLPDIGVSGLLILGLTAYLASRSRRTWRRNALVGASGVAVLCAVTGCGGKPVPAVKGSNPASAAALPASAAALPTGAANAAAPGPAAASITSAPVKLTIAAIGVSSALQSLGLLADGSLEPPTQWQEAGWYAQGIRPGDPGPAVIAGHVDSVSGPAIFFGLKQLKPGDTAAVTQADGHVLSFVVDSVQEYPKDKFPTAAVYGPTPTPVLRLITCTGDFDRAAHSYVDNLVVSTHLVA